MNNDFTWSRDWCIAGVQNGAEKTKALIWTSITFRPVKSFGFSKYISSQPTSSKRLIRITCHGHMEGIFGIGSRPKPRFLLDTIRNGINRRALQFVSYVSSFCGVAEIRVGCMQQSYVYVRNSGADGTDESRIIDPRMSFLTTSLFSPMEST